MTPAASRFGSLLRSIPLAAGLLALLARPCAGAEGDTAARAAAALYEDVRAEKLENGLRVYLKPIPGSPVVSTMMAYKVGSADEDLEHTGLAHYLEHLMFKGTDKLLPGDIDRLTQRNGGSNNAFTTEDYTIFFFEFAADRWEVALDIEADRLRHLRIDARHEFEQEKGAVIEELQRDEDEPWELEHKAIMPLLFGKSTPYGHPVIGERAHVRAATASVIKGFYDRWYHPNNAALVVCGGFDPDKALARIRQLFGPIAARELPPRKQAPDVVRQGPVHHQFQSKFEVARLLMGFNGVRVGEPAYYPLEVLQAVLSDGKTSRLYKKLVDGEEIAGSIGSSNSAGRYPGWFSVQVELLQDKDPKKAEALVLAELRRLRDEPVSEAELRRVRNGLLAHAIFEREGVRTLAESIARGVTTNDLDYLKTYLERISAVTAADVQAAARKYLDPERRVSVWSVPAPGGGAAGHRVTPRRARAADKPASGGAGGFSLKDARREVLDNGLTLLLFENHRLPIVVAGADVRHGRLLEPADKAGVATLMGRLLDEGTARHTGPQIAELIEDVGGSLSLSADGGSTRVLAKDRTLGLRLLFECLTAANFPPDAVARERRRMLSEIDEAEHQPDTRAQLVYRSLVYGRHPLGRSRLGRRETVQALTRDDLAAYHGRVFLPNNTVLAVVGDFDSRQVVEEVKALTAGWKSGPPPKPDLPPVEKPQEFTQRILSMPAAAQLHFYMGHVGVRRTNPDYYTLLVMDNVLGTGPGFTDRLSARLRDREGLAYTVRAEITSTAGEEPGTFTCYIGTDPANFTRVKKTFLEELERIRNAPPRAAEVEDAKKYLLGSLPFNFITNDQVAGQLLTVETYHLGFNYLDDYRQAVAAVTPADVQAVARKYLDPKRMVLVAAGPLDAEGRPLNLLPPPKTRER